MILLQLNNEWGIRINDSIDNCDMYFYKLLTNSEKTRFDIGSHKCCNEGYFFKRYTKVINEEK
jgi:hypothetical protein